VPSALAEGPGHLIGEKIFVHSVGNDNGGEDNGAIRDTIYFARLSAKLGIPSSTMKNGSNAAPVE
jgi:hypothetical protein